MRKAAMEDTHNGHARPLTFDEAYRKYNQLVTGYARKMFDKVNHEEFEALVWERINRLIDQGRFKHVNSERRFVFGILRHVAWEQSKKMRAQYDMISLSVLSDELECPPSRARNPEDIAARRDLLQHIMRFVTTLDRPLPAIFEHYFLKGHNSAWISRKLRMNPSTVRVYIHMLRRKIDEQYGDSY